jgi:cytochrome c peroxidase
MWDGAVNHLDVQALAPISNADEMDETPAHVVQKLRTSNSYKKLFLNAYGDTSITGELMLKALSQFMLTFVSANSRYDSVMRHQTSFNKQEQQGYILFQKNCSSCHQEPLFTNHSFEKNGLSLDANLKDYGRMRVTGNQTDSLKFKVPTLRNIEFSYPYMHDGRFKTLFQVMDHYAVNNTRANDTRLNTIKLSAQDKVDLVSFLLTLTDKQFLFNPEFSYPKDILLHTNN